MENENVVRRTMDIQDICDLLRQKLPPDTEQQQCLQSIFRNVLRIGCIVAKYPMAATPDLLRDLTTCLSDLNTFHDARTRTQSIAQRVVSLTRHCWTRDHELQSIEELLTTCCYNCIEIQNIESKKTTTIVQFATQRKASHKHPQSVAQKPVVIPVLPEQVPWAKATQRKGFAGFSKTDNAVQHKIGLLSLRFEALDRCLAAIDLSSLGSATGEQATSVEDETDGTIGLHYPLFKDDLEACTDLRIQLAQTTKLMRNPAAVPKSRIARELGELARILVQLGLYDRALPVIKWEIKIYRSSYPNYTMASNSKLAQSLNHLSACLLAQYHPCDALVAAQEAVEISRKFTSNEIRTETGTSTLVRSLTQMSACLVCLGRNSEAMQSAEDALVKCEPLVDDRPTVACPDLAACLVQYSCCLRLKGRDDEALAAITRAVDCWRNLVRDLKEVYLPQFAGALGYLAVCARKTGIEFDTLQVAEEAVKTWWTVAEARPGIAKHDLAQSLIHLSGCLTGEKALEAIEDAVGIYWELSELNPTIFEPYFVTSLCRLSVQLGQMDRENEASTAIDKAAEILQRLPTPPQTVDSTGISQSFYVFTRLVDEGCKHEAVKLLLEGQVVDQTPLRLYPITTKPTLARSVVYLSLRTSKLDSDEEMVKVVQDLANEWVKRDQTHPHMTEPGFSIFLLHLSLLLDSVGRLDSGFRRVVERSFVRDNLPILTPSSPLPRDLDHRERENMALKAIELAVEIHHKLSRNCQTAPETGLFLSLHLFSLHTLDQEDFDKSRALIAEAIDCYSDLDFEPQELFRLQQAQLLISFSACLFRAGEVAESSTSNLEAMVLCRELAKERKKAFLPYFLLSQVILALHYTSTRQRDEALNIIKSVSLRFRGIKEDRPLKWLIRHKLKEVERDFRELHWEGHLTYVQSMLA